jgi:ABC-type transport system substrate-binding protein
MTYPPAYLLSWIGDCHDIGLISVNTEGAEYITMMDLVFERADFDMYTGSWGLERFPNHLYDMCHSSQDSALHPGRYNAPGVHDDYLDELVETVVFSLNHTAKIKACHEAQRVLYDINYPDCAFAYMQVCSRKYFNAHMEGLAGIVDSRGYGSHNKWTLLNMHWAPNHPNERIEDGKSVVVWALDEEPCIPLNPCYALTFYDRCVIEPTLDSLLAINPYTHEDVPWIATGWGVEGPITKTVTLDSENRYLGVPAGGTVDLVDGAEYTFNLRTGVHWQCGNLYTPSDAEFNLEFLRNNQVPRYASAWEHIVDVQVINETAFMVYSDATSQWLLSDFANIATLLPPPVWCWLDGRGLNEILSYDPSANRTKPLGAGDKFGDRDPETGQPFGAVTQLYGTGPFIFDYYSPATMTAEAHRNPHYFQTPAAVDSLLEAMFHACGDVDRDGVVWAADQSAYALAFGAHPSDAHWNPDADLNQDHRVDWMDGALIAAYFGTKRDHP